MAETRNINGYSIFTVSEDVNVNRIGKQITVKGRDGTFIQSDSVESNLLFEILKVLKKK